jgi:hypothetical protein
MHVASAIAQVSGAGIRIGDVIGASPQWLRPDRLLPEAVTIPAT